MSELNEKPILKLSPFADYVIECDLCLFGSPDKPLKLSSLINKIVLNFCEESGTVRNTSEKVKEEELASYFSRMGIELSRSHLIRFRNTSTISQKKYAYPPDAVEKRIILNDKALDILRIYTEDESYKTLQEIYSRGGSFSSALFVSALVEEYAKLPMYRREAIYYADTMKTVEEAIRANNDGDTKYLIIDTKKASRITMYPVEILLDEWSTYNYIIGIGEFDPAKGEVPISVKLSNIQKISIVKSGNILIRHDLKMINELYERVKSRGVMFIGSHKTEGEIIKVRLTEKGFNLYNSMTFLRPKYDSEETDQNGDHILTFSCTCQQILYYFQRIGKYAEILEPPKLRKKFAALYSAANELYRDKD